jgi:hypothetical protein
MEIAANITVWEVGLSIGFLVTSIAVVIVMTIMRLASRIADQAHIARQAVDTIQTQSTELNGIPSILDSGVRILHSARSLRKVAVGK